MPKPTTVLEFGTEVDVIKDTNMVRGLVVGITYSRPPMYDIQPHDTHGLGERLIDQQQDDIRLIPEPVLTPEFSAPALSIPRLVVSD
ncbi:hypothetical protein BH10PLA2_BH10PLA2_08370 [soil metagenome]